MTHIYHPVHIVYHHKKQHRLLHHLIHSMSFNHFYFCTLSARIQNEISTLRPIQSFGSTMNEHISMHHQTVVYDRNSLLNNGHQPMTEILKHCHILYQLLLKEYNVLVGIQQKEKEYQYERCYIYRKMRKKEICSRSNYYYQHYQVQEAISTLTSNTRSSEIFKRYYLLRPSNKCKGERTSMIILMKPQRSTSNNVFSNIYLYLLC